MKRILFLIVFFCMNFAWGQSVGRESGGIYSTSSGSQGIRYLGDPFPKYNFYTNGGWNNAEEVQIGYGTSSASMTWVNAVWEADSGANRLVKKDAGFSNFSSIGNWYFVGRYSYDLTNYAYNDETSWTNNQVLNIPGNATYYEVQALGNPTSLSATTQTTTIINLTWSKWNGRDVLIVRNTTGNFTDPTQGTSYSQGDNIGSDVVVYKGSGTSYQNTGLTQNTQYYYKIYSENYSYYSSGETANTTTLTEIFRTAQSGNWGDTSTWQLSGDNGSNFISASSVPTNINVVTLQNGHSITVNTNANAKSITAESGSILNVTSGNTLSLVDALTNNGGTITFENNASLVQTNNVSNTGNITYTRNSTSMKQFDFTYWSSPVAGKFLDAITNTDKLYDFNTSTNNWNHLNINPATLVSTLPMNVGKGYAVRNPNAGTTTQVGTFTGVPNNGDINLTNISGASGNSVLLGNPYPSAIDLEVFHTGSNATNLGNTYYFWTHNSTYNGTTYPGSDYASYSVPLGGSVLGGTKYVAAGQGFFVDKANANTISVAFKNSHRVSGNNSGFFRMAQNQTNSSTATVASDKIWFNLINPSQNILKQTLLAYAETASNGYDSIDALTYDGQPALDFYTLIPSYKFVIQARQYEFVDTDVVQMGYRTTQAGTFQLVIDHKDAVWDNRSIILKDNLLNTYHNIKESAYTFTSEAGTFDSRFEIIYQANALSNLDVSFENAVIVFAKDKNIHIQSGLETIKEVVVYDLQGRIITTKTNINATQIVLENLKAQTQVLLVKVTSIEGKITTKKVIF